MNASSAEPPEKAKRARPLLIIDLDETLLSAHAIYEQAHLDVIARHYEIVRIGISGKIVTFAVSRRPDMSRFLLHVAEFYRLAIWSAAPFAYVHAMVDAVVGSLVPLQFVFTNDNCDKPSLLEFGITSQACVKNLRNVADVDLARTLLLDNNAVSAWAQTENHVPIADFDSHVIRPSDDCLAELAAYLEVIADYDDFRTLEKRTWSGEETASITRDVRLAALAHPTVLELRRWRYHRRASSSARRARIKPRSPLAIADATETARETHAAAETNVPIESAV